MKTTPTKTAPTTKEVVSYLKQHPSFFESHEDLLADMILGQGSEITPFYERQLKVLKERAQQQSMKMDMIVDGARNNQKLESKLLETTIQILSEGQNNPDPVQVAAALVEQQFEVTAVSVFMNSVWGVPEHEKYDEISQRVVHQSSVCDDRVSTGLLEALFNQDAEPIASCAFVPLVFDGDLLGVMVLGANAVERFQPGVGVMFLNRLGLIIGSYLKGRKGINV